MTIALATGDTLAGSASNASTVTYTLHGDSITTGDAFKMLGQGQLAASATAFFTAANATIIKAVHLQNTGGTNQTVVLYANGTGGANKIYTATIVAGGSATHDDGGWRVYDANGIVQSVGSTGPAATIAVGTVSNIGTSGPPTVTNVGSTSAAVFNFGLQQGATGSTGPAGAVNSVTSTGATITVTGTTTTNVDLPNTITAAGPIGDGTHIPVITFDAKGRLTAVTTATPGGVTAVSGTAPVVSSGGTTPAISITAATISAAGSMSATDKKKLNLFIYDVVADYGADPTGAADAKTAIQNAINAAQAAGYVGGSGAIVWFPPGRYSISGTLIVTGHNITLWGAGGGSSLDAGNYYTGMASTLVPSGAFQAVQVIPVQTAGLSGQPNIGFKWKGLGVDCYAAGGLRGLQLISCQDFDIDDFYTINATETAFDFNTLPAAALTVAAAFPLSAATLTTTSTAASGTGAAFAASGNIIVKDGTGAPRLVSYTSTTGTTFVGCSSAGLGTGTAAIGTGVQILPTAQDTTRGRVGQVNIRALDGSGASGVGIRLNGDLGGQANTNLIQFIGPIKIAHLNGIAIKDINSDTNHFAMGVINRSAGGTGIGVEVGAGTTAALASRNNVFDHWSFGNGGLTLRGTPTATFASGPTKVTAYQIANGEVMPTIEAGAISDLEYNGASSMRMNGNASTTALAVAISTTNILGQLKLSPQAMQIGATFRLKFPWTSPGCGAAARITGVKIGPLGTVADPTVNSVSRTPTAVADNGYEELIITILGPLGASCTSVLSSTAVKSLATAVGYFNVASTNSVVTGTPVTFNSASATGMFVTFFMTTGGTGTFSILAPVIAEVVKVANS